MQIHCIQTGLVRERIGTKGVSRYLWAPYRDDALPVNAFAIEHPTGLLLFDTGQTARAARSGYFPRWHPFFRLSRFELSEADEIARQLCDRGLDPTDVRWTVLSHLHTDHVGGLSELAGSQVLVSRVEWERATGFGGRVRGYLPQYWPSTVTPRLLDLDTEGFGPFPGSYDVAGDRSLVVVATPGHTPGHVSLLIQDGERRVLLSGDLEHVRPGRDPYVAQVVAYCAAEAIAIVGSHDMCDEVVTDSGGQTA